MARALPEGGAGDRAADLCGGGDAAGANHAGRPLFLPLQLRECVYLIMRVATVDTRACGSSMVQSPWDAAEGYVRVTAGPPAWSVQKGRRESMRSV